jgi:uncharacterized iron-regulated protein
MSEAQLDTVTAMHEAMFHRLNALEMLHKGGQQAVDEFVSTHCRRGREPSQTCRAAAAAATDQQRQDGG